MDHLLIYEVGDERQSSFADGLVVSFVRSLELSEQPVQEKLADLRKLGVDDGDECCVNGREAGRCHLTFHEGAAKQPSTPDEVFREDFWEDVLDV